MNLPSISNRQLTLLRKLNRKKYREKEQLFVIEGARAVQQIMINGMIEVKELYFDESQNYWRQDSWDKIGKDYSSALIKEGHFSEVTDTDNPQGVLALCKRPQERSLEDLVKQSGIIIATDRMQDPGNLGTVIRTGSWFGVKGILSGNGTVDLFHPKVVRSTAGATGTLPHKNGELGNLLPKFESEGWEVVILDGNDGAQDIREVTPGGKSILIVGNEANGVDKSLFTKDRTRVRISSKIDVPGVESLNAAIATGIALYSLSK